MLTLETGHYTVYYDMDDDTFDYTEDSLDDSYINVYEDVSAQSAALIVNILGAIDGTHPRMLVSLLLAGVE